MTTIKTLTKKKTNMLENSCVFLMPDTAGYVWDESLLLVKNVSFWWHKHSRKYPYVLSKTPVLVTTNTLETSRFGVVLKTQHTSFLWRHTAVNCPSVSFNKIQWHHAYKCRTAVLKRVTASYSGDRLDYHSQVQILLWASKWNINSTKATERNRAPAASVRILLFAPREQVSLENKLRLFDFTFLPIREKPPSPKRPIPVLIASSSTNK